MKKTVLALVLTLFTMSICSAQKIEMTKVFGGYQYTQNGNRMTMAKLEKAMKSNSEAHQFIKKAKSNNVIAVIFGGAGGALIGFPVGTALGGGDANWTLAGVGAGLIAIAIPISSGVNKNTKKAVELYNSSLGTIAYFDFKPEFNLVANGHGIGLRMDF